MEGSRTGGGSCSDSVEREPRRSGVGQEGTDLRFKRENHQNLQADEMRGRGGERRFERLRGTVNKDEEQRRKLSLAGRRMSLVLDRLNLRRRGLTWKQSRSDPCVGDVWNHRGG